MLANCPVYPTLPASDLQRARRFYAEKLGFDLGAALRSAIRVAHLHIAAGSRSTEWRVTAAARWRLRSLPHMLR